MIPWWYALYRVLWRCSDTATAVELSLTHSVLPIEMSVHSETSVKHLTGAAH